MQVHTEWQLGGRTPSWDALWRRILTEVLSPDALDGEPLVKEERNAC